MESPRKNPSLVSKYSSRQEKKGALGAVIARMSPLFIVKRCRNGAEDDRRIVVTRYKYIDLSGFVGECAKRCPA